MHSHSFFYHFEELHHKCDSKDKSMWSSNFISPSVQCRAMAFNSNNDGDDRCCSSQMAKNHALEMMGTNNVRARTGGQRNVEKIIR